MLGNGSSHGDQIITGCSAKARHYLAFHCVSFLLNIIAACTLWRLGTHKTNISHLIVRVLVVSDALSSVLTMIPIIISCAGVATMNGAICDAFGYLSSVFLLWTALLVLLLCTMRYLALVKPLFYRTYVTYGIVQCLLVCALLWSVSHLLLPLVGIGRFKFYEQGQYCAYEIKPTDSKDAILVHITVWEGWLTIIVLCFFTTRMLIKLRAKKKLALRLSFQQRRGVRAGGTRQQGYTLMTVVIVAIFLICYIPFLMFRLLALITKHVHEERHYQLHLLANLNPLINPIIYISFNKSYRKSLKTLLRNLCCCFTDSVNKMGKSSSISLALFSTSSDDMNQNSGRSQRTFTTNSSSFLTVPLHVMPQSKQTAGEAILGRESGHRRCFSDDVSASSRPQLNIETSFTDKFFKRQKGKIVASGSLDVDSASYSPTITRKLSLSSISAMVGTSSDLRKAIPDQEEDASDFALPGHVESASTI